MTDLVTDEDMEIAQAAFFDPDDKGFSDRFRAALEAFAPLLIERLAKEAESQHENAYGMTRYSGQWRDFAIWLRSKKEHDNEG